MGHHREHYRLRAFTIVELLIVVAVVAVLAAITLVVYNGVTQNARDKSLLSDIAAVEAEVVRFGVKNNGAYGSAVQWYSGGSPNANIPVVPSSGNVIDVVANSWTYCIRAYNTSSNKNSITNAASGGAESQSCLLLDASVAAGGTGGAIVGWWKLNGNTMDSTSFGRNGTLAGSSGTTPTLTTGQNGQANGAYNFSTTINQWINTGYNFPLQTLTVSIWAKPSSASPQSYGALISNSRDCCATYSGFQIFYTKGTARFDTRLWYGTTSSSNMASASSLPVDVWYHVVMTYNGQTSKMYVNGQEVYTRSIVETLGTPANDVAIGKGGWSAGTYSFGGDLDDARIYNYPLSAADIKTMYDLGAQ